jgi:prophage antirepressor-like protein
MPNKKMATKIGIDSEISKAITEKKENIDDNVPLVGLKGKAIKFVIDVFTFVGIKFAYVIVGDVIYFRAKDVAEFLGYIDTEQAIRKHVSAKYKFTLGQLLSKLNTEKSKPVESTGLDFNENTKLEGNAKSTIYITEAGLYQLIFGSKKEEADEFRQFVFEDILPNIRKNGSYSISSFVKDTSFATSFFLTHDITAYKNQSIVYIGAVGTYNGKPVYKFGMSDNIESRLKQHIDFYGNQFIMIAVYIVQNNYAAENNIKSLIQSQGIQLKIKINDVNQTEIFTTDNINPILFNVHQLSLQKTSVNQQNSETLLIEMEKTKQENEKTRQLEVQLELCKLQQNKTIANSTIETIIEPLKIKNKCIYKRFLDECTREDNNNIHCSTLYKTFKVWFKNNNPYTKIPSNKEFVSNLRKHKEICKVSVNNKSQLGIRNLQII